jgi:hypothetical protein
MFHEEQPLSQARTRFMTAIPPVAMLLLLIWQVVLGHPWGKNPMSNAALIGWTIFLWLIYLRLMTIKLVTDVQPGQLTVAMRGLWRTQKIPLDKIKSLTQITFDPIADWGGYGIRSTSNGKAYIASGHEGARIELTDGSIVVIGSQKPGELVRAISRK